MPYKLELGVDWSATTMMDSHETVLTAVAVCQGFPLDGWMELPHGWKGYRRGWLGPGDTRVYASAPGRDDCHVVMKGKGCRAAGMERMKSFWQFVKSREGHATRIDNALDDYGQSVQVDTVIKALMPGGEAVRRSRKWTMIQDRDTVDGLVGEGVYIASKSSDQRLLVYNKALESKGDIVATRFEYRAYDESADLLMQQIIEPGAVYGDVVMGRMIAVCDFRELTDVRTNRRSERCSWWDALVGDASRISGYVPRPIRTLDQIIEYQESQRRTLAMYFLGIGGDYGRLQALIRQGAEDLTSTQRQILAAGGIKV